MQETLNIQKDNFVWINGTTQEIYLHLRNPSYTCAYLSTNSDSITPNWRRLTYRKKTRCWIRQLNDSGQQHEYDGAAETIPDDLMWIDYCLAQKHVCKMYIIIPSCLYRITMITSGFVRLFSIFQNGQTKRPNGTTDSRFIPSSTMSTLRLWSDGWHQQNIGVYWNYNIWTVY